MFDFSLLIALAPAPVQTPVDPVAEMEPPLRIEAAWVREAPPVADVLAAYAVFCNDGEQAVTLAGASSPAFDRVEMHVVIETERSVTMEQSNSVVVGPTDCVEFAPGDRHFMLFDPAEPVRDGAEIEFTFLLADGQEIEATFPVRRADEMMDKHEHRH